MKKLFTMILVGLMVFASVGGVFAEEFDEDLTGSFLEEQQEVKGNRLEKIQARKAMKEEKKAGRLEVLKEFLDEIHQVNALRMERHTLRAQVIEKNDALLDLYIAAKESGNEEALAAAKEKREQIKGIHEEIKGLQGQVAAEKKAFKEAVKNGDKEGAQGHIEQVITLKTAINGKIQEKIALLEEIIDILS